MQEGSYFLDKNISKWKTKQFAFVCAIKQCHTCNKKLEKNNQCSACKTVGYCNQECQKQDWKMHKVICPIVHSFDASACCSLLVQDLPHCEAFRKRCSEYARFAFEQSKKKGCIVLRLVNLQDIIDVALGNAVFLSYIYGLQEFRSIPPFIRDYNPETEYCVLLEVLASEKQNTFAKMTLCLSYQGIQGDRYKSFSLSTQTDSPLQVAKRYQSTKL